VSASRETFFPTDANLRNAIDMAFQTNEACAGMCDACKAEFIRDMCREADFVWAVYPDAEEEHLFHLLLIKGADRFGHVTGTAFMVPDRRIGELMHATLGDGVPAVTHEMPAGVM